MATLLEEAVAHIRAGSIETAKPLLIEFLKQNPGNEDAWLWMSRCITEPEQKKYCFEKVLKINPQNQHAIKGLERLSNPVDPKKPPRDRVVPQSSPQTKPSGKNEARNILVVIGLVIGGGFSVCVIAWLFFSFGNRPSPPVIRTPTPELPTLGNLALSKAEIETDLRLVTPLEPIAAQFCQNSNALQCVNYAFTSSDGDLFVLVLEKRSSHDEAVDYAIARSVQLKTEQHATEIDIPHSVGNYRWLVLSFIAGEPVYYGGAADDVVRIEMIWSRTSSLILEEEASQAFSRLLDRQIAKIKR